MLNACVNYYTINIIKFEYISHILALPDLSHVSVCYQGRIDIRLTLY